MSDRDRHRRWREKKRAEDPEWWQRRLAQSRELRKERGKEYEARRDHKTKDRERFEKHPEKLRAKWIIKSKKLYGTIEVPPCVVCGAAKVELHHPDYRMPHFVIALCHPHHRQVHWREKNEVCHAA